MAIDVKGVTNCTAVLDSEGDLLSLSSGARVSVGQWRVFAAQGLFLTLTSVVLLGTVWLSLAAWEVIALSHSIKLMLALHPANEAF